MRIVHLSDLHLLKPDEGPRQDPLIEGLFDTLHHEHLDDRHDLVVITGDLFDSPFSGDRFAVTAADFFRRLKESVGPVCTVVLPGNHDRRSEGVKGPHLPRCFAELRESLGAEGDLAHVRVFPFSPCGPLVELLPGRPEWPADVALLDTTRVLQGKLSAGGLVRAEELLLLHARLPEPSPGQERPLVLLIHHHLIPTPVTDRGRIWGGSSWLTRLFIRFLLPRVVAFGDREELTMTAFGAGTALSTLQSLGRAVLVLHGHKHYPVLRIMVGPREEDNDVALASAGCAGLAEPWISTEQSGGTGSDEARIWPSFNVVSIDSSGPTVEIKRVRFSPSGQQRYSAHAVLGSFAVSDLRRWTRRRLASDGAKQPTLSENAAIFELTGSDKQPERYDIRCNRHIRRNDAASEPPLEYYLDIIEGPSGSSLLLEGKKVPWPKGRRRHVHLPFDDAGMASLDYVVRMGACRTSDAAARVCRHAGETYGWIGLMNRYDSGEAVLCARGLTDSQIVFGSRTDLATGEERPSPVSGNAAEGWSVRVNGCPARTLLRLYWALETECGQSSEKS